MSSEAASATDAKKIELVSYYIETTDGMFRVNVPEAWSLQVDHTKQGSIIASFVDERDNDRLLYTGVQSIRDSSAHIQELTPSENQPDDGAIINYEWIDRSPHVPISRYTSEAVGLAARRRRRVLLEDNIDDGFGEAEIGFD